MIDIGSNNQSPQKTTGFNEWKGFRAEDTLKEEDSARNGKAA